MLDHLRSVASRIRPTEQAPRSSDDAHRITVSESELARARHLVAAELRAAEADFWTQWDVQGDLEGSIAALRTWDGWRTALARLEAETESDGLTFLVDSLVLQDGYHALFTDPEVESIVYLTGLVRENVRTLNRCLEVTHATQSVGGAETDSEASFETLFSLESSGHQLLGHAHNHPGSGATNATPSRIDQAYQQRLEGTGYETIGLVMTEDGYVRFFTNTLTCRVEVYGTHVRQHDEDLFRLEDSIRNTSP